MSSLLNKLTFITRTGVRSYHRRGRKYQLPVMRAHKINQKFAGPQAPISQRIFGPWNYDAELSAFSNRIHEQFDMDILKTALLDSSFLETNQTDIDIPDFSKSENNSEISNQESKSEDNTDLSIEGETICKNYVRKYLKKEYPLVPEEGIDVITEFLTSESTLSNSSLGIGTKELILASEYPPPPNVTAKAFKALVGAVNKSQSLDKAELFVRDFVVTHLFNNNIEDLWEIPHPLSTLKTLLKKEGKSEPEPRLQWQAGYNTIEACFQVGIYCDKELIGESAGETPDIAVEMAALDTLLHKYGIYNKVLHFD